MMFKKKYNSVVIDIDNTLTDLQFVLNRISSIHKKPEVLEEAVASFRLAEAFLLTTEEESSFWADHEESLITDALLSEERARRILLGYTKSNTEVHLVSNRPKLFQKQTEAWVRAHNIPHTSISCIGKQSKLQWILESHPEAEAVFEDNPDFFYEVWDAGLFNKIDTYCVDYTYNYGSPTKYRLDRLTGKQIDVSKRRFMQ